MFLEEVWVKGLMKKLHNVCKILLKRKGENRTFTEIFH